MNLLRSAHFRIVLVSVATSALVLLVFGTLAFLQLRANRLQSLDKELTDLGGFIALAARWDLDDAGLRTLIQRRVGEDRAKGCIYAVHQPAVTTPGFRSSSWPADLDPQAYPHSEQVIVFDFEEGDLMGKPPRPPGAAHDKGPKGEPREEPLQGLFDPLHQVFGGGPGHGPRGGPPKMSAPRLYEPVMQTVQASGRTYRLGVFGHEEAGTVIHLGFDLAVFAGDLDSLARTFWLALPLAMIVIAGGAWFNARRSMAPVHRLTREMEDLSTTSLHSRLDASGADQEYQSIIHAYNTMLARLEKSFEQASRFSADASHELKTPLAVMRATLEQALGASTDGSADQRAYASLLEETSHLQSIIEALLLLSRADAGKLMLSTERLDFITWLRPLVEDAELMAEARHITVHADLQATAVIAADPVLLQRAVHNLLRNAVAYNEDNGQLWCATRSAEHRIRLIISNTGPTIPAAERARIFERFARGTNAGGTGEGRGLGIGLSLAREIVLAHGGTLELADEGPGTTTLVLTLPKMA